MRITPCCGKKAVAAVHEIYLGKAPEKFTYKGKEYTPQSFYKSTGLNPSDYVSLTSYTHRPFYTQLPIEVQDNCVMDCLTTCLSTN